MATYITLINSVLAKLRESSVSTPGETTYSALIGELVNEAKQEVEDAWDWVALRDTITLTTVADTAGYVMTGAGNRFHLYDENCNVWNNTDYNWIPLTKSFTKFSSKRWKEIAEGTNGTPSEYRIQIGGVSGVEDDSRITFYPSPDGVYDIRVQMILPQADFSVGTEVLRTPARPVILGAYLRALAERGEDQGNTHGEAVAHYNTALQDAIAIDVNHNMDETTWHV